jgi:Flp pilus assembly protein TadG
MTPPRITGAVADDRGAAAIMIAVAMLAIVGFMAFAIDPGVLFQERRELQVGAEAAALAIAQDCATGAIGCSETDDGGFAKQYVDANASDGEARVVNIDIDTSAGTVTVEAGTLNNASNRDGDPNTTDLFFGPAVGVDAFEVRASATATWGPVGGGTTLPLIFGECEYVQAGGNLDAGIQPTGTMIIGFHFGANNGNGDDDDDDDPCFFNNGQDIDDDEDRLPGGFGWLQQTGCEATLGVDNYVDAKTGNATPQGCSPQDLGLVVGNLILVPMFDNIPQGNSKTYHVVAFVGIRVEGFKFPGNPSQWRKGNWQACNTLGPGQSESCLVGTVENIFEPGAVIGGPDTGANTIQLTG